MRDHTLFFNRYWGLKNIYPVQALFYEDLKKGFGQTYPGIEMNVIALLILLVIIAVSVIFLAWNRSNSPTRLNTQRNGEIERPIHVPPDKAPPEVVIHYDIDIREEPPLAREKTMTLHNSGAPAFKVQIQDIAYKAFVARFPPVPEVTRGENKSVQAEIYHNNQIAGLLRRDFVRILEAKLQDTDGQKPICLEARVSYEDAKGMKFCSLHDIEYGPGAKKVSTLLKQNGQASETSA